MENLHWKDVALMAILLIQGLIGYTWVGLVKQVKANEQDIHDLQTFEAATEANRFTAPDAFQLQSDWTTQLEGIRSDMREELKSIRECINTNLVEGRRVACN